MNIDKNASQMTRQICNLAAQGLTPEQICEAFPDVVLTPEAVELCIRSATTSAKVSFDDFVQSKRKAMAEILCDIAEDETKNESARVKAATVIFEGRGMLPLVEADEVSKMFRRMEELRKGNDDKILQMPSAKAA